MCKDLLQGYVGPTQQARVITEQWAAQELYCPDCLTPGLEPTSVNCSVVDYFCGGCSIPFQLKSSKSGIGKKIPDGAYNAMISAIREDRCPDLLLLGYRAVDWRVLDVVIIPRFALSEQAVFARKPLSQTARRAGWVGCVIDLTNIAPDARISIVENGVVTSRQQVKDRYSRLKPVACLSSAERGWTLAVLNAIQSTGWTKFSTQQAYGFEARLSKLFPFNKHIRQKIRQQLQVLRDLGLLTHMRRSEWCTRHVNDT